MSSVPKVSVLIPTYNYAHHLDEAIESVLNQTFKDFELIIVDDQSTDNTDEVVSKYLTDKKVRYFKNEKNIGLANNFNKSLEYANGEYIKYLLADDRLHPQLLEKFVAVMDRDHSISLITSNSEMFGMRSKTRIQPFKYLQAGKKIIEESLKENNGNWIGEPSVVMFRKSDLRVGKFNTNYTCFVDWDMWLRLLTVGDCYIVPETLSYFRSHDKQASKVIFKNYNYTFEDYDFYKNIQKHNPYKVQPAAIGLHHSIRKKATYCGNVMFESIPSIRNKTQRKILLRALKIAYKEGVILTSLLRVIKGVFRKISPAQKQLNTSSDRQLA